MDINVDMMKFIAAAAPMNSVTPLDHGFANGDLKSVHINPVNSDLLVSYLYNLWNIFNLNPIESKTIRINDLEVEKCAVYHWMTEIRITRIFWVESSSLLNIPESSVDSLLILLESYLRSILGQTTFTQKQLETLSDFILVSWWSDAFGQPKTFELLSKGVYSMWLRILPSVGPNLENLLFELSKHPDHMNVFITNLLHIFVECVKSISGIQVTGSLGSNNDLIEDPASKTVGTRASVSFRQLSSLYKQTFDNLNQQGTLKSRTNQFSPIETEQLVVKFLKKIVRLGLVDCLRQRPELPIQNLIGRDEWSVVERLNMVRDLYLVQACRTIASRLNQPSQSSSLTPLPNQFQCLIHATAPKHLINSILTGSTSQSNGSDYKSTNKHTDLIVWCLDQGLDVQQYALWFVTASEIKDVESTDRIANRLLPHAKLLASDATFCFALIIHLDRIRKATLPDHVIIKLLRSCFSHLTIPSKCKLLKDLQNPSLNPTHASPFANMPNQFDSRLRCLFNRLVVLDTPVNNLDDDGQGTKRLAADKAGWINKVDQSSVQPVHFDREFLLDCELSLFTNPLRFLTTLISLPSIRKCGACQPAVLQLLDSLSYCFQVCTLSAPDEEPQSVSGDANASQLRLPTLLTDLLLVDWDSRKSLANVSLFGSSQPAESGIEEQDFLSLPIAYRKHQMESPVQTKTSNIGRQDWEHEPSYVFPSQTPTVQIVVQLLKKETHFAQLPCMIQTLIKRLHKYSRSPASWTASKQSSLWHFISALFLVSNDHSFNPCLIPNLDSLIIELANLFQFLFLNSTSNLSGLNYLICTESDLLLSSLIVNLANHLDKPKSLSSDPNPHCSSIQSCLSHLFNTLNQSTTSQIDPVRLRALVTAAFSIMNGPSQVQTDDVLIQTRFTTELRFQTMDNLVTFETSLKLLLDLNRLQERTGLMISFAWQQSQPGTSQDEDQPVKSISPQVLLFIFNLASFSGTLCQAVLDSCLNAISFNRQAWSPAILTLPNICLALLMFLRSVSRTNQPQRWYRLCYFLEHLLRSGALVLPFPLLCETQQSAPGSCFYFIDWTAFRGIFDFFNLLVEILKLWIAQIKHSESRDRSHTSLEFRLLCRSLSDLVPLIGRHSSRSGNKVEQLRFEELTKSFANSLIAKLQTHLQVDWLNGLGLSCLTFGELQRLQESLGLAKQELMKTT